jgi:O-antigen/teichoic acid export membrane protein
MTADPPSPDAPPPDDVPDDLAELTSVTHGAVVGLGGTLALRALRFLLNLVLAQGLGVAAYGVYAFGYRLATMLTRLGQLGTKPTLVRLLPKHDDDERRNRTLGIAYATVVVTAGLLAAGLFVSAPIISAHTLDDPLFVDVLRLFALFLPFNALVWVVTAWFQSLEMVAHQTGVFMVALPGAQLVGAGAALAAGFSVLGVVAGMTVAVALVFVASFAVALSRTGLRPMMGHSRAEVREFAAFALPTTAATLGALLRGRIDVLLVGALLSSSAAGIYNVAFLLAGLISVPLAAFNQLFPPVASRLYSNDRMDDLLSVYSTVTRWIFTVAVAVATVEVVYGAQLLGLFGEAFSRGETVLLLFVGAMLVGTSVGATGWLLMMTDHQYVEAANSWVLGLLNVVLSVALIREFGLVGAAMGTGGALAVVNVVRLAELYHFEGLQPFTRKYLKPLAAAVAMGAAMHLVALVAPLSGGALVVVGVAVGLAVFVGVLRGLGIEDRDRVLVGALARRYGAGDG